MHPFFPVDHEENAFFFVLFKNVSVPKLLLPAYCQATVRKAFQKSFFVFRHQNQDKHFHQLFGAFFSHLHAVASCSGETAPAPAALSLRRRTLLSAPLRTVPSPTANARRTAALCLKSGKQKYLGFRETQCELICLPGLPLRPLVRCGEETGEG